MGDVTGKQLGLVSIVGCFSMIVAVGMVASGHSELLVPLAGIGGGVVLAWRPVQVLTRWLEGSVPVESSNLEHRVAFLERELAGLRKEQTHLLDTIHWQEQLLHRTPGELTEGSKT